MWKGIVDWLNGLGIEFNFGQDRFCSGNCEQCELYDDCISDRKDTRFEIEYYEREAYERDICLDSILKEYDQLSEIHTA